MGAVERRSEGDEQVAGVDEFDELADAEARGELDSPPLHRSRAGRSEVFSVRLPESASIELRRRAELEGVSAGVVLRQWALSALTAPPEPTMTHQEAMTLFRETLQEATFQAVDSAAAVVAGHSRLNLGPKLVHDRARDRNRRLA